MLFFGLFSSFRTKKNFLTFFTLKISNLSYSLITSLLGTPNFRGMWHWGLMTGSDWWLAAQWWVAVGCGEQCWLVVGGSHWWLVRVQWVGGWPWLVCGGWWVGSDLSSQFYIYYVQCCLTQCLTWPPPIKVKKVGLKWLKMDFKGKVFLFF